MLRDRTKETLEVEARITDALIEMGSWEDVYVELYTRGVTGIPEHGCACPVARWIESQVHEQVTVTAGNVYYFDDPVRDVKVSTPENVYAFVIEFDNGNYPELVSNSEDN